MSKLQEAINIIREYLHEEANMPNSLNTYEGDWRIYLERNSL